MGSETRTYFDEPSFYMGALQSLGFVIWHETPTLESVQRVATTIAELERQPGTGFAMMVVLTPACAPVGPNVRQAFESGLRVYRESALGFAVVIEAPGVLGGLTRAIARTLTIVSHSPFPINTYPTVAEAAEWLSQILLQRGGPVLARQTIIEAVHARCIRH
jgi:hypothetical protein